jgi:hypothetical protein
MPAARAELPFRQVHLDFHTSPLIPDVARDWDAAHFVETLKAAHVNSVTCFAKCHHGMSYYDTQAGTRHPSLGFDLLRAQIDACHAAGIRVPIYYSIVWENHAAEQHPEWQQRTRDGRPAGPAPGEPGWKWMCLNTGYTDYVEAQVRELLAGYPCDGFFFDILLYQNSECHCEVCRRLMAESGLDASDAHDQRRHVMESIDRFMERITGVVHGQSPESGVFYNNTVGKRFARRAQWQTHVEIEALPTGGWGYSYFPYWVRYVREFGLETLGMTGRFQKMWADFGGLKTVPQLDFECASMLANGSKCSIGDQLHPRGRLDPAVYQVIGESYAKMEAAELWCSGAEPLTQIGLLMAGEPGPAQDGAGKMLLELHHQFCVLNEDADFSDCDLLIIPDTAAPTPALIHKLAGYLQGGGRVLFSHEALLDPETGDFALADRLGVRYRRRGVYQPDYFKVRSGLAAGIRDFPYICYEASSEVEALPGAEVLADVYGTYFNRTGEHFTSHGFTPATDPTGAPAVVATPKSAYLYGAFFTAYWTSGARVYRKVVENCLERLLPNRLVRTSAPSTTEVTLTRQRGRSVVHLVNYHPQRRGSHVETIEEVVPLCDVSLELRLRELPSRAYLAPSGADLLFEVEGGVVKCVVPEVDAHAMVVFEP